MEAYSPSAPEISWRQKIRILRTLKRREIYTDYMVQFLRELSQEHLDDQLRFEEQRHEEVVAVIHEFRRRYPGLAFEITEVNVDDRRGLDNVDILVVCLETHMREYLTNRKEGRSRKEKAGHWNNAPQGTPASDVLAPATLSSPGTCHSDQGEGHMTRSQDMPLARASGRPRSTFPQPSAGIGLFRTSSTPTASAGELFDNGAEDHRSASPPVGGMSDAMDFSLTVQVPHPLGTVSNVEAISQLGAIAPATASQSEDDNLRNNAEIDAVMHDYIYAALNAAATMNFAERAASSATFSNAGQCVGEDYNEVLTMSTKTGLNHQDVTSVFDCDTYHDGQWILPSSFRTSSPGPLDSEAVVSSPSIASSTQSSLSHSLLPWLADHSDCTFLDAPGDSFLDVEPTTIQNRTAGRDDQSAMKIDGSLPRVGNYSEGCNAWLWHDIVQRSDHGCMLSECGSVVAGTPLSEEKWDQFEAFVREL